MTGEGDDEGREDGRWGEGGRGWAPASARTTEGEGRFANRPCGGLAARLNVTGDDEGHPYGKRVRRGMMLEGVGRFPNRPYGETGR